MTHDVSFDFDFDVPPPRQRNEPGELHAILLAMPVGASRFFPDVDTNTLSNTKRRVLTKEPLRFYTVEKRREGGNNGVRCWRLSDREAE